LIERGNALFVSAFCATVRARVSQSIEFEMNRLKFELQFEMFVGSRKCKDFDFKTTCSFPNSNKQKQKKEDKKKQAMR